MTRSSACFATSSLPEPKAATSARLVKRCRSIRSRLARTSSTPWGFRFAQARLRIQSSEERSSFSAATAASTRNPTKINPLPAPPQNEGVQFYAGGWDIDGESEDEVCFASYYDFTDQVPAEYQVD